MWGTGSSGKKDPFLHRFFFEYLGPLGSFFLFAAVLMLLQAATR
jgi:hypothetical protein